MAKTKQELRDNWEELKEVYREKENASIALEDKYEKMVAKIRRSKPKNVPQDYLDDLENLWEKIRKAHVAERSAKHDSQIAAKKALKNRAIAPEEIPEENIFNTRGVRSQEKLGINRTKFNESFYADDRLSAYERELLETELASWADITPMEARELYIIAAMPSDSQLSFDERCIELFQTHGKTWKRDRLFIDLETTALDPYLGEIIEIGIVRMNPKGEVVYRYEERFDLERKDVRKKLGVGATEIHRISPEDLEGKRKFSDPEVQKELGAMLNDPDVVITPHHAAFEHSHLSQQLDGYHAAHVKESAESLARRTKTFENGIPRVATADTRVISTYLMLSSRNTLEEFATSNGVDEDEYKETAHGALADADMTSRALWTFRKKMQRLPKGTRVKSPKYKG